MNGSGALQRAALTGDVTVPVGSNATTIANDAVTYAKMQNTAAASVLLGRGSAAGAGDPQEITLGTNLSMSGATLNATGGGTSTSTAPQGRLTLQAATPVMITTQAAQTTIRYAPYVGSMLPIYDGTNMVMTAFTELSIATTDTTKSPAAIGASKVNDWFVWNDAGTLRLGHGVDWTNDTTPVGSGSRPGLTMVNGIWTNQAAITNGPAINRGTYVGTTRSNASSSLDFIFGTRAANGGQSIVGVWNCYNRVLIHMVVQDTTASWTYSAAAWNFFNGSATWSVLFVAGLAEDPAMARCIGLGQASATGYPLVAPSFDNSVTALPAAYPASLYSTQIVSATGPYVGEGALNSIGYHNCSAVSYSTGGTVTFIGNNYASLIFDWRC
jgi:hypothetical protein